MGFCENISIYTGVSGCDIVPGKPVALIFAPKDVQLADADVATPLNFFQAAISNANPSLRAFPVTGILQNDFSNTEANMGTLAGYGYSEQLADTMMGDIFQFKMSVCKAKALQQLSGYSGRLFILTDNGVIIGSKLSSGKIVGLPLLSVSVTSDSFHQNAQAVVTTKITVNYGSGKQLFENLAFIQYDFDVEELVGITEVELKKVGEFTYQVITKCNGVNLYDSYGDKLAEVSKWKAVNANTGAALTVATPTKVADTKAIQLVISGVNAPYKITVQFSSVADGFEQSTPYVDEVNA
jgi:hypothetical protein